MEFGIYYAYWEQEWEADFLPYVRRVKQLGFDLLEVACGSLPSRPDDDLRALREEAEAQGVRLTGGYGPLPSHNLSSPDEQVQKQGFAFYEKLFPKMRLAGIQSLGGALYSYWPVDYTAPPDKEGDLERSVRAMQRLSEMAGEHGISLHMEALNRFEGYLLNTAEEALQYVKAVGRPNVKVMLDTFHMNIEEDSIPGAIRTAGPHLGELHVGEANRRPPREGGRISWPGVLGVLKETGFEGPVVLEPFERPGGRVGRDIKIWRDLSGGGGAAELDRRAAASVAMLQGLCCEQG